MQINFNKIVFIFFTIVCVLNSNETVPTLQEISDVSGLELNYQDIEAGKIITLYREDQEIIDTSIALSMGLYLKASYTDVLKILKTEENQLSDYEDAMAVEIEDIKNIKPYFEKAIFTKREKEEVEKLYAYTGGDAFNLSKKEIEKWHLISENKQNHNDLASQFFQEVLIERTQAYINGGLDKISSYEHSNKDSTVAKGFKSSSLTMKVMKKWFPELYEDYLNYPKVLSQKYEESFYLVKDKIEGRPAFTLKHQMVEEKNSMLIIAQRQFYISNGLDAIGTQIICMPYKNGTFVAMSTQTFTNKVAGFGRFIAVKVGRNQMAKQIRPIFESLQEKFNN